MTQKLSHSQIRLYNECPKKYKLHYKDRLRPKTTTGALIFGSAIDKALNHLLETSNLEESQQIFTKSFSFQEINGKVEHVPTCEYIVYAESDFDSELLNSSDKEEYLKYKHKFNSEDLDSIETDIKQLKFLKKDKGFLNLSIQERKLYAFGHWLSMNRKGIAMIDSYSKEILPKIKKVLAVQKPISTKNDQGDEVAGFLDLVVTWEDGKNYLLDNKTSTKEYEKTSPMRSQQLVLYYHIEKEQYNLHGAGFIVLYKHLIKNKTKVCTSCSFDGSGTAFKTCNNIIENKRCGGEWEIRINPKAKIEVILNEIPQASEDLVIETFDLANEAIKSAHFNPNLNACINGALVCPYFNYCWKGDSSDLVKIEKKENT